MKKLLAFTVAALFGLLSVYAAIHYINVWNLNNQ